MVTARIGSRATALVAMLLVLIGANSIADRLGAFAAWVTLAMIFFVFGSVVLAGLTTRTIRLSTYRAAARRLGRTRGGAAAVVLVSGSALLMVQSGVGYAAAVWIAGLGLLGFSVFVATPLHNSCASGLGAFAIARYRSPGLGALTGLVASLVGLGLAWHAVSLATASLALVPAVSPVLGRILILVLVITMLIPGGQASLAATAAIITVVVSAAALLPVLIAMLGHPQLGGTVLADLAMSFPSLPLLMQDDVLAVLVVTGLITFAGLGFSFRSAATARNTGAGAVLVSVGLAALAMMATAFALRLSGVATALDGLGPLQAQRLEIVHLGLPTTIGALVAVVPSLLAAAMAAVGLRFGWAGLVDDLIYGLSGWDGTASGRLAIQRWGAMGTVLILLWGEPGAWPEAWVAAWLWLAAAWPLLLVLPALSRTADRRIPLILGSAALLVAPVLAANLWEPNWWLLLAVFALAMAVMLMLLRSADSEDMRLADIVAGRTPGPLMQEPDA